LFISGFTAGYPKLIPQQLVNRARAGERFKINLFAGASNGDAVDGILAEADLVAWRRPYMSNRLMREKINRGEINFKDDHLSRLSALVRAGDWGNVDVTVVEALAITEKGHLIPTMSVGNTPSYVKKAEKIIIEIASEPPELEGIHDIFIPEDPPYRMPIPIYRAPDRIGKPFIEINPDQVVAIVMSSEQDSAAVFFIVTPSTAKDGRISAIVPMVTHVDHSEHSVDVVLTEHGLVDTRPLTPRKVAEQVIKKCAHPDYRDLLWEYYQRAVRETGGHEPHLLGETFFIHRRFKETGDMRVG
jgi:acyl-CoA hydrolase